jgi:hypothetical protein
MGLCIGLSIVTVIELVWLLLNLAGNVFIYFKMLREETKRKKIKEEMQRTEAWQ